LQSPGVPQASAVLRPAITRNATSAAAVVAGGIAAVKTLARAKKRRYSITSALPHT
jgi:hypothetical protein